jgi:hypothetical protein
MCTSKPKAPKTSEAEKPAILLTARDGLGDQESATAGRKNLRIDLNKSTSTAYGSSLVIPS